MSDEPKFKVGDKVAVSGSHGQLAIDTIKKITPTGRIGLERSNVKFSKFGSQIGGGTWSRSSIYLATQEIYDKISHDNLAYHLSKTEFGNLALPQLREFKALPDKFKEAPE